MHLFPFVILDIDSNDRRNKYSGYHRYIKHNLHYICEYLNYTMHLLPFVS